jgi:hypothetical protein
MNPKNVRHIVLIWVVRNAEFDADFVSIEKVAKSSCEESQMADNFFT